MDSISELPDALLLNILSLLHARDVVSTMVLSKRWQLLWMMVPRLIYDDSYQSIEYERFSRFIHRSLLLHEAPVIETLHFKLGPKYGAVDIGVWTRTALKRCVRELTIKLYSSREAPVTLPRILYTRCSMLVKLKLKKVVLVDVTSPISFPSLKELSLLYVKYPDDEFVQRLLSKCPVLESLNVKQCPDDNVTFFTVKVPCLKSLVLARSYLSDSDFAGFEIDAPSLERFDIFYDYDGGFCDIEHDMPNIVEANVDVTYIHPGKFLRSIISVKRLYLCLSHFKDVYPVDSVFHRLVHLEICTCQTEWLNLLICLLRDSPKLQSLKLNQFHEIGHQEPRPCWIKPSSIPESLLSSLETLEWERYEGTEEEKELVAFILKSGSCLKNVTISSNSTDSDKKLEMIKELTLSSRRSPTCELAFH